MFSSNISIEWHEMKLWLPSMKLLVGIPYKSACAYLHCDSPNKTNVLGTPNFTEACRILVLSQRQNSSVMQTELREGNLD